MQLGTPFGTVFGLKSYLKFSAVSALSAYYIAGFKPGLVFDFENEKYFTDSLATTFDSAITHNRSGNATMVDSDGLLKWAPHNLFNYSDGSQAQLLGADTTDAATPIEGFSNSLYFDGDGTLSLKYWSGIPGGVLLTLSAYVELDSGAEPTFPSQAGAPFAFVVGGASPSYVSGYNVTHVSGNIYQVSATMISGFSGSAGIIQHTNQTLPFKGTRWQCYRSDLGGMVNNPDRGDSYVPTTSSAVYLPRRGHHVYNGTSWVNEGLLHESEQRVNLLPNSNDLSSATNVTKTINSGASPSGEDDAILLSNSAVAVSAFHYYYQIISLTQSTTYTISCYVKYQSGSGWVWLLGETDSDQFAYFNIQSGTVGTTTNFDAAAIEDVGNGWYRISATFTKTSASTSEQIGIGLTTADNTKNWNSTGAADQEQVLVYGFQLEAASTPSSYIPTSGATVTRAADTLTVPSANLPWPTPNVIGEELVTNGTFDTDTSGWTTAVGTSTFTVESGQLSIARSAVDFGYVSQSITTETGKVYLASFDLIDDGPIDLRIGTTIAGLQLGFSGAKTSPGAYTLLFVATGTTTYVSAVNTANGTTATIDNISVREIDPLAVSIQMEGRATGDTLTTTRWYLNANNYITQEINTSDFTFEQANAGTVDAVTGGSFTSGVNTAFNIASRHGSTFINGAVDGTALTANTTPTALPDLSTTDLSLAYAGGPMILKRVRIWADDLGDAGIAEASA